MNKTQLEILQEVCEEYQFKLYEHSKIRTNRFLYKSDGFGPFWRALEGAVNCREELKNVEVKTSLVIIKFVDFNTLCASNTIDIIPNEN